MNNLNRRPYTFKVLEEAQRMFQFIDTGKNNSMILVAQEIIPTINKCNTMKKQTKNLWSNEYFKANK